MQANFKAQGLKKEWAIICVMLICGVKNGDGWNHYSFRGTNWNHRDKDKRYKGEKFMFNNGLECLRADFHLHTHRDKEFSYTGEENSFVKDYVDALKLAGIQIGVITNHNKFDKDEYKAIRKAANKEDIFILPGVELTVKEGANGIHTLIVFNPDEWLCDGDNHIQTFLTAAFATIPTPESRNTKCTYDLKNTLERLEEYGRDYFVVFAHVDQNSGLFCECDGGLLSSFAKRLCLRRSCGVRV